MGGVDTQNTLDGAYDEGGAGAGRIITADNGAVEVQGVGGIRVEGNIVAAESIVHDADADTFIQFTSDRIEADAGGRNYIDVDHANQEISFNEDSAESDFRIESGTEVNMFFVDGGEDAIGIGTNLPQNPLHIGISTPFDLNHANIGQDGIFIVGQGDNSGTNAVGGSISFGPPSTTRGNQRKSAISSIQTSGDIDHTGLAFYVHGNAINQSPMVEGMRLTHQRRLGVNNNSPSANLDVIGPMQFEDGNEAVGYVLTSDASGNATWADPNGLVAFVDEIDELLDGKSDSDGSNNGSSIFLGLNAGAADDSSDNKNVGIGFNSLNSSVSGLSNVGIGYLSLEDNISGNTNTAIGTYSLRSITTATSNTGVGNQALANNLTGNENTAIGSNALRLATGIRNTTVGHATLQSNTTGSNNVVLGHTAGEANVNGSGNIFIGFSAAALEMGSNKLYIENSNGDENNALIYGEFDNDILRINGDVGIGRAPATNALEVEGEASKTTAGSFVANSDRRLKKNIKTLEGKTALEKIENLRGVTYLWNDNKTGSKRPEGIQYGFIAQEIQEVFPEKVSEDHLGYLQTAYGDYDALFVQAIKEQQLQIEELSEENKVLKTALSRVFALEARLKVLESVEEGISENVAMVLVRISPQAQPARRVRLAETQKR